MHKGPSINTIALGDTYRDTITGFEGVVTARIDYLTGCAQASLTANINGEVHTNWFDYPRLEKAEQQHERAQELAAAGPVATGGPAPTDLPAPSRPVAPPRPTCRGSR